MILNGARVGDDQRVGILSASVTPMPDETTSAFGDLFTTSAETDSKIEDEESTGE